MVQKALGHASITTTTIYTHLVDEELENLTDCADSTMWEGLKIE